MNAVDLEKVSDGQLQLDADCPLALAQTYSKQVASFLNKEIFNHFRWVAIHRLIAQRQLLIGERTHVGAFTEVLPMMVCRAVGGSAEKAIPLAANWWLLLFAAQMLDDAQDQDVDWMERGGLRPAEVFVAGVYAMKLADRALAYLDVDCDTATQVSAIIDEMQLHGLYAQATERTSDISSLTRNSYYVNTIQKSANLFAVICEAGARVGSNDPVVWQLCNTIGMQIGLMKQIQDDCADLHDLSGKSDLMSGHYTLPVIRGLEMKEHALYPELLRCLQSEQRKSEHVATRICALLNEMHVPHWCFTTAELHRTEAVKAIQTLPVHLRHPLLDYAHC